MCLYKEPGWEMNLFTHESNISQNQRGVMTSRLLEGAGQGARASPFWNDDIQKQFSEFLLVRR